jgi:subtilisin family serine protease
MRKIFSGIVAGLAVFASLLGVFAQPAFSAGESSAVAVSSGAQISQSSSTLALPARTVDFITREGKDYGLALNKDKTAMLHVLASGDSSSTVVVESSCAARLSRFIAKMPQGQEDARMADALKLFFTSYNSQHLSDAQMCKQQAQFFTCPSEKGNAELTAVGKHAIIDIMTAQDGQRLMDLYDAAAAKAKEDPADSLIDDLNGGGTSTSSSLANRTSGVNGSAVTSQTGTQLFDGAYGSQFDWSGIDSGNFSSGSLNNSANPLSSYAVDPNKGTIKVMIAGRQDINKDYMNPTEIDDSTALDILKQAGIDPALVQSSGAHILRTTDNVVTVEVPLANAQSFGETLQSEGLDNRPALKLVETAAKAVADSPLTKMLPLPVSGSSDIAQYKTPQQMLHTNALAKLGSNGSNAVVGIIDSGVDANQPDLKGRILDYFDFTDDAGTANDKKDVYGHGTHVAGLIGGSGAASDGKYTGVADQTKFVVFKAFNANGETSEDILLAAMKKAESLPANVRPQVINMSLGSSNNATSAVSIMADRLAAQDNILVVAAAGNEGQNGISAPGNAKYAMTVAAVDSSGKVADYSSRGAVTDATGQTYTKPDIAGYGGSAKAPGQTVNYTALDYSEAILGIKPMPVNPTAGSFYGGIISDRSSDEARTAANANETLAGNSNYRYDTGTSMATGMLSGIAADVTSYLIGKGQTYNNQEVKALVMEGATDTGDAHEAQGAGLVNGDNIAANLKARSDAGVPVGNIAYMLSQQLTTSQRQILAADPNYSITSLGILDKRSGHLISTEVEMDALQKQLQSRADSWS